MSSFGEHFIPWLKASFSSPSFSVSRRRRPPPVSFSKKITQYCAMKSTPNSQKTRPRLFSSTKINPFKMNPVSSCMIFIHQNKKNKDIYAGTIVNFMNVKHLKKMSFHSRKSFVNVIIFYDFLFLIHKYFNSCAKYIFFKSLKIMQWNQIPIHIVVFVTYVICQDEATAADVSLHPPSSPPSLKGYNTQKCENEIFSNSCSLVYL